MNYLIVYHLKVNLLEEEERDMLQFLISKTTTKTTYTHGRACPHTPTSCTSESGKWNDPHFPSICPPSPELVLPLIFLPRKIQGF